MSIFARRTCRPWTLGAALSLTPLAMTSLAMTSLAPTGASAQQHAHEEDYPEEETGSHHGELHFSHPLIAESVSPDTKIRIDHQYFDFPNGEEENSGVLEAEYAFHPSFSIEMDLPYTYTQTEFGNLEIALKFANYAFERAGLLLGYGVELGFPTNGSPDEAQHEELGGGAAATGVPEIASGVGIPAAETPPVRFGGGGVSGTLGSEQYELAPFVNLGFQRGGWELVGWLLFEIPFHQEDQEEVAAGLGWNASILYRVSPRLHALLELEGSGGVSGEAVGEDVVNIAPGIKFAPLAGRPLFVGVSAGFPLAEEKPFDSRIKGSLFWHF